MNIMSDNKTSSGGIGFTSLLLVAFIVLKLCNVIAWSWWWVLSPAWVPAGLAIIALIGYAYFKTKEDKKSAPKSKWQERLDKMQQQREKERGQKVDSN
jgi:hypothetical protein